MAKDHRKAVHWLSTMAVSVCRLCPSSIRRINDDLPRWSSDDLIPPIGPSGFEVALICR
jgi:hypothetical protein